MDESSGSFNADNSLYSKETNVSSSSESQIQISLPLKERIIKAITINLQELILENKQSNKEKFIQYDIFYLSKIPLISLGDYIKRIVRYTKMDISTLILSVIYIDQFCDTYKYVLSLHNIYRILLSACILSIKFNEDTCVKAKKYAEIAGVSVDDLNNLEYFMFFSLDSLLVDYDYYSKYFDYFSKYEKSKDENKSNSFDC